MLTRRRSSASKEPPSTAAGTITAGSVVGPSPPAAGSPAAVLAAARGSGLRMRPSRPIRALAGALLVVASVIAALALYTRLGDRTEVLALTRDVLAGEQLRAGDLQVVSLSTDDDLTLVSATDRDLVVGRYARVRLGAGSLLVGTNLQDEPLVNPDRVLMSVEVPAGQVPLGLRERSRLVLVLEPPRSGATAREPTLVEATVAAIPRNFVELVGGGDTRALVALTVEVPSDAVAQVGAADGVSVGVVHHEAPFPGEPSDGAVE